MSEIYEHDLLYNEYYRRSSSFPEFQSSINGGAEYVFHFINTVVCLVYGINGFVWDSISTIIGFFI